MSSARADARAGFYELVSQDPSIGDVVGRKPNGRARIYPGPLTPELSADECPRITYTAMDTPEAAGRSLVRIQTDISVAPNDDADTLIEQIDSALLALLEEHTWEYGIHRIYALALNGMPISTSIGRPRRFTRDYMLRASPRGAFTPRS